MLPRGIFGGAKVALVKVCCRLAPWPWRSPLDLRRCRPGFRCVSGEPVTSEALRQREVEASGQVGHCLGPSQGLSAGGAVVDNVCSKKWQRFFLCLWVLSTLKNKARSFTPHQLGLVDSLFLVLW